MEGPSGPSTPTTLHTAPGVGIPHWAHFQSDPLFQDNPAANHVEPSPVDGRSRIRRLPVRFRDDIPQPLTSIPPPGFHGESASTPPDPTPTPSPSPPPATNSRSYALRIVRTPRNAFGLYRRYCSYTWPSHDPEENVSLDDLSATPAPSLPMPQHSNPFHPYPNQSSFKLGDWFWNEGPQLSRKSFGRLLDIIGDPEFRPEQVRDVPWAKIDATLGSNDFDGERPDGEWEPEWMQQDAGWKRTPITISAPFHSQTVARCPQNYVVGDLYHRSIVSVVREKLANPVDAQNFHYDPFQVFWKSDNGRPDVQVHGELYTSRAFLEAHQALQESPGEPGCNLPRVIVGLMFWSDATHLTSFGSAKLWPCYLFFGNESKYRRCKPTSNLCNHVAYFQAVSPFCHLSAFAPDFEYSSQMHLRTLLLNMQEKSARASLS
jgi:Plavaka transposase